MRHEDARTITLAVGNDEAPTLRAIFTEWAGEWSKPPIDPRDADDYASDLQALRRALSELPAGSVTFDLGDMRGYLVDGLESALVRQDWPFVGSCSAILTRLQVA